MAPAKYETPKKRYPCKWGCGKLFTHDEKYQHEQYRCQLRANQEKRAGVTP